MTWRSGRFLSGASLLIGLLVLSGLGAAVPAFPDLRGHWAQSPIMALALREVASGFADGTFHPYAVVTRAETAKWLAEIVGTQRDRQRLKNTGSRFGDLTGHWAVGYVEAAAERGLIYGYQDATFRPEQPVRRDEAVALVVRAAGLTARARQMPRSTVLPFTDADAIPAWVRGDIWVALNEGLLQDLVSDSFQPQKTVNRAEMAALMARLLARRGGLHDLSGVVESWDESTGRLALRTAAGVLHEVRVPGDAVTFRAGVLTRQFKPLDQVWVVTSPQGEAVYAETRYQDVTGHTVLVQDRVLTFLERGSWFRRSIAVAAEASVFLNGRPAAVSDLSGAHRVYVVLDVGSGEARIIDAVRYTHSGVLAGFQNISGAWAITLTQANGQRVTLPLTPETIAFQDGLRVKTESLPLGAALIVAAPNGGPVTYIETDQ